MRKKYKFNQFATHRKRWKILGGNPVFISLRNPIAIKRKNNPFR